MSLCVPAALALLLAASPTPAQAPVAVFSEPGFPYYIASPSVAPELVQYCLRRGDIEAELVSADQLADPAVFSASRFTALAYVYGNTFPVAAYENLRRFHADGGCIIAFGGVPFCHPCVREEGVWVDKIDEMGWDFVSHEKLGTGIWAQAEALDKVTHAKGDPLGLAWLPLPHAPAGIVQFPGAGLPPEDTVIPVWSAVKDGAAVGHPACIIEHGCGEFAGAIDIWAGTTLSGLLTLQQHEQLIVAACDYVLERKGLKKSGDRAAALAATRSRYAPPLAEARPGKGPFIPRARRPEKQLHVLDIGAMTREEQMLALSIQGLVNRKRPRVYVVSSFQDGRWLDFLLSEGHERIDCPDLSTLVRMHASELRGAIVYDPAEPHSVNVATTLCGLQDAVMCTEALAKEHGLPTVDDLRGRCSNPARVYERLLARHWGDLDHRNVACMMPSVPAPRDYLIQHRIFTFWLDAEVKHQVPTEQMLFFERLMARMPPHSAVHGWWQEGDEGGIGEWRGVHESSKYAKITVCTVGAHNLSIHSGGAMPRRLHQREIEYGSLGEEIYISFMVSDGDNFGMNLYSVIGGLWEQPMRGKVPIGWAMCPTQAELTPGAVRYWSETATGRDLFLSMDGLGYIYPDVYGLALGDPDEYYSEFLRRTRAYMQRLGHEHLWYLGGSSRVGTMARVLDPDGLFGEYGVPPDQRQEMIGNVVVIWADLNPWEKPYTDIDVLVDRIRKRTPDSRPAFLFVGTNGFTVGPNEVARILTELGPEYIAVRPDELCHLFRKWKRHGVDEGPAPREPLDLTLPPAPGPFTREDGTLVVREDDGRPEISGWHTDPAGTAWVRKHLTISLPEGATEATVHAMVRGPEGTQVTFRINDTEGRAPLSTSGWTWVGLEVPTSALRDGENEVWYTGNPEARLYVAGDASTDLGHSDFGSPGGWTPLSGELMCWIEVR